MVYSTALLGGQAVAALYTADQPPHWNSYVTVASADETALAGGRTGRDGDGRAVRRARRRPDGRDRRPRRRGALPVGAARAHRRSLVNAPGALAWNDLVTPDPETAARFYGGLFGWTLLEIPVPGYTVIQNDGRSNGGMLSREGMPPALDALLRPRRPRRLPARIGELGGACWPSRPRSPTAASPCSPTPRAPCSPP